MKELELIKKAQSGDRKAEEELHALVVFRPLLVKCNLCGMALLGSAVK